MFVGRACISNISQSMKDICRYIFFISERGVEFWIFTRLKWWTSSPQHHNTPKRKRVDDGYCYPTIPPYRKWRLFEPLSST